jgi:methanogenesis marker radical SAM protein
MHDPTPEASLETISRLAKKIEVYAAIVVLPGVNDGTVLTETLSWLSGVGVKGVILMRFANCLEQGLILENAPILPDQRIHTIHEFFDLVRENAVAFSHIRISGTPLYDPLFDSPFAICKIPELLDRLPKIEKKATIITGTIASPYIRAVISACGGSPSVVVEVDKEIACLITIDDFMSLHLSDLCDTVIIPGRAFVHDAEVEKILSRDGVFRTIVRGPEMLSADGEMSMGMTEIDVLTIEMEGFSSLIQLINQYGGPT